MKKHTHKKTTQSLIKLLFLILIVELTALLGYMLGRYVIQNFEYSKIAKKYELQETVAPTIGSEPKNLEEELQPTDEDENEEDPISNEKALDIYLSQGQKVFDHNGLKTVNADYCGWIDIPGTPISYPVVKSKDNTEYLKMSFEGKKRSSGSIFVDANIRSIKNSKNLLIHGHNMKSGSMFASLPAYRGINYYNKHPFVYFYTPDETLVYQVISAYTLKHDANEETAYQDVFLSDSDYENFIKNIMNRSVIQTNVNAENGEQILTLSTCVNHSSSRFIVHAVRYPIKNNTNE